MSSGHGMLVACINLLDLQLPAQDLPKIKLSACMGRGPTAPPLAEEGGCTCPLDGSTHMPLLATLIGLRGLLIAKKEDMKLGGYGIREHQEGGGYGRLARSKYFV